MPKKCNKVIYNGNTLIDLTSDTAEASDLMLGTIGHNAAGEIITGTIPTYNWTTRVVNDSEE